MPAHASPQPDWPLIVEDLLNRADQLSQVGAPANEVDELLASAEALRLSGGRPSLPVERSH